MDVGCSCRRVRVLGPLKGGGSGITIIACEGVLCLWMYARTAQEATVLVSFIEHFVFGLGISA